MLKRLVALSECRGDILPVETAEKLVGAESVAAFRKKYPTVPCHGGYLGAGSREKAREKRKISKKKLAVAKELLEHIAWIPWIDFAGVTGSVCYGNAKKSDDIDVLLVVQNGRVWLTRLLEGTALRLRGSRRVYGSKDIRDQICVNYYLSSDRLNVKGNDDKDFLRALELVMMVPVLREEHARNIYAANSWASEFFPVPYKQKAEPLLHHRRGIFSLFIDVLEICARWGQIAYMMVARHPVEKSTLKPDIITFFDKLSWDRRLSELEKRLQTYDV